MIKRFLKLPIRFRSTEYEQSRTITLDFSNVALESWCLELTMLEDKLSDRLTILKGGAKTTFQLDLLEGCSPADSRSELSDGRLRLHLTPELLSGVRRFFMECYRDGRAKVNHVDIEMMSADGPMDVAFVYNP